MVKPTTSLALTALGVSTAMLSVAATSCPYPVTVTTTVTTTTTASGRPSSCFPTELDCAVLVSYCAATSSATSVSASSSVRGPPGSSAETSPYERTPAGHGGTATVTATATATGHVTWFVPGPESTIGTPVSVSSASVHPVLDPSSGLSQGPPLQHHTSERANCSSCTGTLTPSAPRYASSSTTHSEALFTSTSSATATGFVSASSSNAGSPHPTSATSDGTSGRTTANQTATAQTSGGVPTEWPEHHTHSSWGTGTGPYVISWHRTDSPSGYDFSVPASSSMSSGAGVFPTVTSFSESIDAATGSVSTSSGTAGYPGTTLLTTKRSSEHSYFSVTSPVTEPTTVSSKTSSSEHSNSSFTSPATEPTTVSSKTSSSEHSNSSVTSPVTEPTTVSSKTTSSQTSSRDAPSYAEPPSYRARARPFKR